MDAASRETIDRLKAECLNLRQRNENLRVELDKQSKSREYLLAKNRSRDTTPAVSRAANPVPLSRGRKRSHRERREEPEEPAGSGPLAVFAVQEEELCDPFILEIVMPGPGGGRAAM